MIAGHSLEALFRNESGYLLGNSNANIMVLCLQQKDNLNLELVLDRDGILHSYLKRYHVQAHTLVLETLRKENELALKNGKKCLEVDSIQNLLIDSMPKHKIKYFEEMHKLTKMVSCPLYSHDLPNVIIGYVLYCYLDNSQPHNDALEKITGMVERIITPFYDSETKSFTSRCIHVASEMPNLTSKERHVLKYLLAANSYAEIAEKLHISVNTVKTHIKNIYAKYNVGSKLELANKINGGN